MLKVCFSAVAVTLAFASAALAAAPPANQEECVKAALALAEKAEAATGLPEPTIARLEELLAKLESDCDAGRFPEADATATEIEAALAGK